MRRQKKACEECEGQSGPGGSSLRERIWETQLAEKREIYLNSDINDSVIELVVAQIQNINTYDDKIESAAREYEREPIKLFINTNGGELYAALAVCSAIEASTTPVHTIALGKALSAGFIILVCGHRRFAQRYSTLMYHTGSSGAVGTITDIIEEAEALERLNEKIHQLIKRNTDVSSEQLDEVFFRKSNWYLEVDEALSLGVIDEIHGVYDEADEVYSDACAQCSQQDEENCSGCINND